MNYHHIGKITCLLSLLPTAIGAAPIDSADVRLGDVVVTGSREATDVRHLPYTVSVVGHDKLAEGDRPNVLSTLTELVPGLFTTSRGMMGYGVSTGAAGGINLRGISGGSGQLLVLIDGHPQYQGIYGHPLSDSYQTMIADRVEVLHGPASLLYGSNAMGGVINIVPRTMKQDGSNTEVRLGAGSWGTMQAEATQQVKAGRFSSTVAANYARTDNHRPRMGFEQYGGYLHLSYDFVAHWKAFVDGDITHFNAANPGPVSSPLYGAKAWITRGNVSLGVDNDYGWTNGRISAYTNFGRHKINDGTSDPTSPQSRYFRSKDNLAGISLYQNARLWQGSRLTLGFDYQHIYGRAYYTSIATGEILDTPNKQSGHSHRNEVAGYLDLRQDIASWLTLDAGLRLDYHNISGSEWVPQGGFVIRPIETGELRATASKGFRNPTMREMYLYPPSTTDLRPERLMQYEVSWRHRFMQGRLSYGINLYHIDADNIIETVRIDGRPRNVNSGSLHNNGIEAEVRWQATNHLSLSTNHSLLHMHRKVIAAPEYKGYLGGEWRQGKWQAGLGVMQIAGLYTLIGTNAHKENYTMVNANVSYQFLKALGLWLRGENLLAQRYEINAGFPMPRATFMAGVNLKF